MKTTNLLGDRPVACGGLSGRLFCTRGSGVNAPRSAPTNSLRLLLLMGALLPVFAQTGVIAHGSVLRKDYAFHWQSRLEPPSPPLSNDLGYGSGTNQKNGNIYRIMIDRSHHTYFGYEVHVEPLAQRNSYRVNFQPLDLTPEILRQLHIDDPPDWKKVENGSPAARPLYPFRDAPDVVHTLDVVAVDLLMNPQTGQKIVDYVVLQEPARNWTFELPQKREFAYAPGPARDFSVKDAALTITEPRVRINDVIEESSLTLRDEVSGPVIWIYIQNRGRCLLSLVPQPGFHKAGEVRGTSMSFTWGSDKFAIASASRIASGDTPFNLYVKEEAGWKPASAHPPGMMFGDAE